MGPKQNTQAEANAGGPHDGSPHGGGRLRPPLIMWPSSILSIAICLLAEAMKKLKLDDWITDKWKWVARLANTEAEAWTPGQHKHYDGIRHSTHNTTLEVAKGAPKHAGLTTFTPTSNAQENQPNTRTTKLTSMPRAMTLSRQILRTPMSTPTF